MKNKQKIIRLVCVQAAVSAACGVAYAGTAYTVVQIGTAGGYQDTVASGVSDGQQVGLSGNGTDRALSCGTLRTGGVVDLTPAGFISARAQAVSGGQQVGYGSMPSPLGPGVPDSIHALLWNGSAASAVDLNPAGYPESFASAAFNGQQGGYAALTDAPNVTRAVLWSGSAASDGPNLNPFGFSSSGSTE